MIVCPLMLTPVIDTALSVRVLTLAAVTTAASTSATLSIAAVIAAFKASAVHPIPRHERRPRSPG